jgi:hypothetical protein
VRPQVVHQDDIARLEPGDQAPAHVAKENPSANWTMMSHQLRAFPLSNCSDKRQRLPGAAWSRPVCALATRRPAVLASHVGSAKGFIEKDELPRIHQAQEGRHETASPEVFRRVSLRGDELLFLCV